MCVKIDYQCGQDPIPVDRAGEHRADYGEGENHPCIGEKKKSNKGPELGRTDLRNKPLRSSVASVARDFGQASGHFLSPFNRKIIRDADVGPEVSENDGSFQQPISKVPISDEAHA